MATIRVHPVSAQTERAGAVVEIHVAPDARPPQHLVQPLQLRLAGRSYAFTKVCTDLETHCRNRTWVLLEGEPGVGKLALTEAVHRSHSPASPLVVIQPQDLAEARPA